MEAHGYDADEAIRRLLNMGEPPEIAPPTVASLMQASLASGKKPEPGLPKVRPIVSRLKGEWKPR